MPAPGPHAEPVNAEEELFGAENLRELRLALDVIDLFLPERDRSQAVTAALRDMRAHLCAEEDRDLKASGAPDRYLIIRPVSLSSPPPPEDMRRITDAVRTLASLGMLAGRGDTR
jgi:hypothetical protein